VKQKIKTSGLCMNDSVISLKSDPREIVWENVNLIEPDVDGLMVIHYVICAESSGYTKTGNYFYHVNK
jgi:hypothetical protein